MPGISLRHCDATVESRMGEQLDTLCHDDRYAKTISRDRGSCRIGYTAYEEYPVEEFRTDKYHIIFEGYIYEWNGTDIRSKLSRLILNRFDQFNDTDAIADWIRTVDGEFVLVAIDETTEHVTILGDCLGRLPLYYAASETSVAISREYQFAVDCLADDRSSSPHETDGGVAHQTAETEPITSASRDIVPETDREIKFDRMAIAQFLLFGHTLGRQTFVAGVERLPPAPFVHITDEEVTVECLHEFNFETKVHQQKTLDQNASGLAELFDRACRTRAELNDLTPSSQSTPTVISLSGGLDSRAVLSSFAEQDLPCIAATMDYGGVKNGDIEVANELTKQYNINWEYYSLSPPNADDVRKNICLKNGRDPLMPYLLVFFDELYNKHETITYITGAGGDMVLPDLRPPKRLADIDAVVDCLITESHRFSIDDVANITGVRTEAIRRNIRERIKEYPETSPDQLYVHFRIYERARNWLFEAEDTNRCYFWSPTPFYSLPFFTYAMNCPNSQKRWYRLYSKFLKHLSENAGAPPNANFSVAPASPLHPLAAFAFEVLQRYPDIFDAVKPTIRRIVDAEIQTDAEPAPLECIRDQSETAPAIAETLSVPALRRILDPSDGAIQSRRDIYLLLTVTSFIDEITSQTSFLERKKGMTFE